MCQKRFCRDKDTRQRYLAPYFTVIYRKPAKEKEGGEHVREAVKGAAEQRRDDNGSEGEAVNTDV